MCRLLVQRVTHRRASRTLLLQLFVRSHLGARIVWFCSRWVGENRVHFQERSKPLLIFISTGNGKARSKIVLLYSSNEEICKRVGE